ncbi:RsmD family RNA methyltransferase, partial [Shigella sonnei]|nr:RsmD family RNA methyltransferase [Shigella sonnei]
GQDLTGKTVLDLFGGSGALGMEAASRNAKRVVIADNNRQTVQTLEKNSRELGLGQVQTVCSDGIAYLANLKEKFDVVF